MLRKNSHSIFNPQGLYSTVEGFWVKDLVDTTTGERTGPIFVPPGTLIAHDDEAVDGKEADSKQ